MKIRKKLVGTLLLAAAPAAAQVDPALLAALEV
jgi:hypothetical protein